MKILQISSAETFGGGERHLVDLAKGLAEAGHQVYLAIRPTCQWLERIDFLPEERIFKLPIKNSVDFFSSFKLAQIIRSEKIDILHAHLARDYMISSLAVRWAPPTKFVITRHVLFPFKKIQKYTLGNVARVIAVSGGVENELQKIFPARKITRIYNGIDVARFSAAQRENLGRRFRADNAVPLDVPLIGTVGELKELKGQRDFVLAAGEIAKSFPEARFAVIGRDNSLKKEFRRELKRLVKIFGLKEKFLWLDWVEDTRQLLSALDVFVSPSHSESFGLAILEAMANETAVVAASTVGACELLQADVSGALVEIKNPVAISDAVNEILGDDALRSRLAANARQRAVENFGLEKMISATLDIYRSVLE